MSGNQYEALGVDYEVLDQSKRSAILAAQSTSGLIKEHGGRVVEESRGASAFVLELGVETLAFVIEGLGTKSVLARQWQEVTGEDKFREIGIDAIGAIVNDVISVGGIPIVVNAYFSTGHAQWHAGSTALVSLIEGWRQGCEQAGAVWGGGESPALPGLVSDQDVEIAGSCIGRVPAAWGPILGAELAAGDAIVLVESSGLHANGATLVRSVAGGLPDGLRTVMADGERLGSAALAPSILYVGLVKRLLAEGIQPSYLSHITGHGFRKLMRPTQDFTYTIEQLPPVPEVLRFVSEAAGLDSRDAYGTFNMGAGLAVYVRPQDADGVVAAATSCGLKSWIAGRVDAGPRRVVLRPLDIEYDSAELDLS